MSRRMVLTALAGIPTIQAGDDLASLIAVAISSASLVLEDGDVLVLAQKIVSKAEARSVRLADVVASPRAVELAVLTSKDPRIVELILREAVEVLRCRTGLIIVEHRSGLVMANAGIDASNVDGKEGDERVLLLPEDSDLSAARLREGLRRLAGRDVGIVIADSFGRAWRNGTVGTAIGLAGPPGLWDMRGLPDRNGRVLKATEVAIADELAAGASLLMGQADEGLPVVHVRGFPLALRNSSVQELIRERSVDLFR
jgi:coenzyme F420-0:L-glutamate ligase/coenzyme F420-1:gamma-L-glutamate ligase